MQHSEFADEIFRLWPKAFQPHDQWHAEIVSAVTEFSVTQLQNALLALKLRRAGRAIDIEAIVEACRNAASAIAPKAGGALAFNREAGAYIGAVRDWLRSRGLSEAYHRLDVSKQVRISRLCAVLWGGSHWEVEADKIARDGQPWERLDRLFEAGMKHPQCDTTSHRGWFPPWSKEANA